MLHYYKFRQDCFDPVPAKDVYGKPGPGKGRPEQCPPLRAANAFGWDVLANYDVTFVRKRDGSWACEHEVIVTSDFDYDPPGAPEGAGRPLTQNYAWFWERGQKVPHEISDNVYEEIKDQVKVSTFLYLKTDPNEMVMFAPVPAGRRPWTAMTAVIEPDWYPASYPWHAVLVLDPREKKIKLHKGEPICRLVPVRRDTYFAGQMSPEGFGEFFERGQRWLSSHGRPPEDAHARAEGTLDITRTYVKQQMKARFVVLD